MKHGGRRRQQQQRRLGDEGNGAVRVAVREEAAELQRHCEGAGAAGGQARRGIGGADRRGRGGGGGRRLPMAEGRKYPNR